MSTTAVNYGNGSVKIPAEGDSFKVGTLATTESLLAIDTEFGTVKNDKQSKGDATLTTTSKTIVGAINELDSELDTPTTGIKARVTTLESQIADENKVKIYDTVAEIGVHQAGDIIEVLGYYEKGDGGGHKRKKNIIGSTYEWTVLSDDGKFKISSFGINSIDVDSTTKFIEALTYKNLILDTNLNLTQDIYIPSYTTIEGNFKTINTTKSIIFNSGFEQFFINNIFINGSSDKTCFIFNGNSSSTVKQFYLKNSTILGFDKAFDMNWVRKFVLDGIHCYTKNGIEYRGKSAEVNITNSWFSSNGTTSTTFGIYSHDNANGKYPEGLTVSNTLFFRYGNNLKINSAYVFLFNNCYFDGLDDYITSNILMGYETRNYNVKFENCWFYGKGILFSKSGANSPLEFRSTFNNCLFDSISNTNIRIESWCHDIFVNDCEAYGLNTGQFFMTGTNQNNYIKVSNLKTKYISNIFVFNGVGENNTFENIDYAEDSATIFFAYPVDKKNIKNNNDYYSYTTPYGTIITKGSNVFSNTFTFNGGKYEISMNIKSNITSQGYLSIEKSSSNIDILGTDILYLNSGDKNIQLKVKVFVKKPTNSTITIKSTDSKNGVAMTVEDYFANFSIYKII